MSPAIIAVIVVVIIALIVGLALLLSGSGDGKQPGPADPLANQPGHDHSKGADNCAACQASAQKAKVKVPEKCMVSFRIDGSYKGEFGFDWIREGDTGLAGDAKYDGLIGAYGAVYATDSSAVFTANAAKFLSLRNTYESFASSWKKDAKGDPYQYIAPWLSLFPKDQCSGNSKKFEAKLKLAIEVESKEPDVLRVDFDKDFFELDKTEITPKTVGKNSAEIKITCIKEFDKDQEINIYPYKEGKDAIAGKLMIVKNNKANRYKAKVVFVKMKVKINAVASNGSTTNEQAFLEKYLFQSLTSLELKEEDLNLVTDATFNAQFVIQKDPATKVVSNYRKSDSTKIHVYLESKLSAAKPEYNDWYKVFFFDEGGGYFVGTDYRGLNGGANDIPSKSVVLFNSHNTSTTTHELLHAMGLYHTFDNDGQFTYKIGETENIMDYSHQSKFGSKDRISTWKWQWDKLHTNLSKE